MKRKYMAMSITRNKVKLHLVRAFCLDGNYGHSKNLSNVKSMHNVQVQTIKIKRIRNFSPDLPQLLINVVNATRSMTGAKHTNNWPLCMYLWYVL